MECQEVLERISPFIDGVLDQDTTQAMKAHLAQCASCARELQATTILLQAARNVEPVEPPSGLAQAIRSAITRLETEQKRCAAMLPLISAYVDGELPADQARSLEAHATQCENCRKEIQAIRQLTNATSAVEPVEPPADLRSRIAAAVAEAEQTTSVWSRLIMSSLTGWLTRRAAKVAYATAIAAAILAFFVQLNAPTNRASVSTIQMNRHSTVAQTNQSTDKITPQKQAQTYVTAAAQPEPAQNVVAPRMQPRTKPLRKFSSNRVFALASTKRVIKHSSDSIETKLALPDSADSISKDQTDSTESARTSSDVKSEVVAASATEGAPSSQADNEASDKRGEVMVAAAPLIEPEKIQEMIREIKAQASMRRQGEQAVSIAILRSKF